MDHSKLKFYKLELVEDTILRVEEIKVSREDIEEMVPDTLSLFEVGGKYEASAVLQSKYDVKTYKDCDEFEIKAGFEEYLDLELLMDNGWFSFDTC
jgi:hypothetical protein